MKRFLKSYFFNFLLIGLFTGIVLWFTCHSYWNEILEVLTHASPFGLVFVFLLAFLGQCLLGLILQILTRLSKKDYKFYQGLVNALVASFFHGVTPGASGGQFAQVFVFRKQGVSLSESASILWMDFILYQSSMSLAVLILFLLRFKRFSVDGGSLFLFVFLGFLVNLMVIAGLWAVAHMKKLYTFLSTTGLEIGVFLHIIKDKEKALMSLNLQLERFESEKTRLKSHLNVIVQVVLLNLVRQCLYYSIPYFCALVLGVSVQLDQLVDIMALSSFVSMMNCFIPIPGSSGGTEATFMMMFSMIFDTIETAGMMILWRFVTYYFIMILGGLTFVLQRFQIFSSERGEIE